MKMQVFSIVNFKKGESSSGFAKEFLFKRMKEIKQTIMGQEKSHKNSEEEESNLNLNVISRLMKNVTTPVLIEQNKKTNNYKFNGTELS